ncbi:MAG: hypothetical protein LH647_22875 [Leptolyngbyaceae cyanobacterium CAN_BIN12]|nr:hypothetical protein [Leptolyngbyaceae cyanobacterium CAN_BIN12]
MNEQPRDPQTHRFQEKTEAYARKPVSVLLPKDIDAVVRTLPNRTEWLRRVISEAVKREGLLIPDTEQTD